MTNEERRPNDGKDKKAHDAKGEDARDPKTAPEEEDFESAVEARSRLLGEGQERGASDDDEEVRQSS